MDSSTLVGGKRQDSMNHVPSLQGATSRETLALK